MDRTNEGASTPPPAPPPPIPTQTITVTPDNVAQLGALFSVAADCLEREVNNLLYDLRLRRPWLNEPVSKWMWEFFHMYFLDGENSFANVVKRSYDQHVANTEALRSTAALYGRTDELNAEVFRLHEQLRG